MPQFGNDDKTLMEVNSQPGIQRDGTQFDGNYYTDGLWCRFRKGRPKKMGGYREIANGINGPIRAVSVHGAYDALHTVLLSGFGAQYLQLDQFGNGSSITGISPAGWVNDATLTWQFDNVWSATGGGQNLIFAHAGRYLQDITDSTNLPVYYAGPYPITSAFQALPVQSDGSTVLVSGGVVALHPYLFIYGNDGLIRNSDINTPTNFVTGGASQANAVNVSGSKVVKGLPMRGGGNAPAGLFWSLEDLIRVTFVGGTALFNYDCVSSQSSILSPNGVVEYDGIFYWAGVDRFLMYNGVLAELPNAMNQDFFFDNINMAYRCKVWATKVPRWGEIWWMFPKYPSTECNWAVVYNVRENTWYDTPITRSAGYYPQVINTPIWMDSSAYDATNSFYRLWQHEFGLDQITQNYGNEAVQSYFTTGYASFVKGSPVQESPIGYNSNLRLTKMEPDFVAAKGLTMNVLSRKYAQDADAIVNTSPITFDGTTSFKDMRAAGRLLRLQIVSNSQGGNYHAGRIMLHAEQDSERA